MGLSQRIRRGRQPESIGLMSPPQWTRTSVATRWSMARATRTLGNAAGGVGHSCDGAAAARAPDPPGVLLTWAVENAGVSTAHCALHAPWSALPTNLRHVSSRTCLAPEPCQAARAEPPGL